MPVYQINDIVEINHPLRRGNTIVRITNVEIEEDDDGDEVRLYSGVQHDIRTGDIRGGMRFDFGADEVRHAITTQRINEPINPFTTTAGRMDAGFFTFERPAGGFRGLNDMMGDPIAPEPRVLTEMPQIQDSLNHQRDITPQDYNPQWDAQRLYSFTMRAAGLNGSNVVLTPVRHATGDYSFYDEEGNEWVNSFSDRRLASLACLRDTLNTKWCRRSQVNELLDAYFAAIRGEIYTPRTKKKLRRKYGEMPTIKDPSNYADKQFIA